LVRHCCDFWPRAKLAHTSSTGAIFTLFQNKNLWNSCGGWSLPLRLTGSCSRAPHTTMMRGLHVRSGPYENHTAVTPFLSYTLSANGVEPYTVHRGIPRVYTKTVHRTRGPYTRYTKTGAPVVYHAARTGGRDQSAQWRSHPYSSQYLKHTVYTHNRKLVTHIWLRSYTYLGMYSAAASTADGVKRSTDTPGWYKSPASRS
jgi:hypothetical protein